MHIPKPKRVTKGSNSYRIGPSPNSFKMNVCQINMNVFARFDEIHSMTLQDIKEICTHKRH